MKNITVLIVFGLTSCAYGSPFALRVKELPAQSINTDAELFKTTHVSVKTTVHSLTLITQSGIPVPVLFFDRGSNVAMIMGQGLPAPKESMFAFAQLFDTYDIFLFDYRWNNRYISSLCQSIITLCPTKRILLDEEEEVRTVVRHVTEHKKYDKVVALGECYSNFLFAKIQADDEAQLGAGPFTHLVLDSCWLSLKSLAQSISEDPYLPLYPQEGGAPWILKKITSNILIKQLALKVVFTFLANTSIQPYLAKITVPILFVHGLQDQLVPTEHFEQLWNAVPEETRVALITPYAHSDNLGNKAVYRFVVEQFTNSATMDVFLHNCRNIIP